MNFITNKGESLEELTRESKVLLVFLRHFGCTFCRETMADLAQVKDRVEGEGTKIVLVHMVPFDLADEMLKLYDLQDISHISDIHQYLYRHFGLKKTTFSELFGLKNWWRVFVAGLLKGHLVGRPAGDPYQMPGVFLFYQNKVLNKFTYRYVSDRPDFVRIAQPA